MSALTAWWGLAPIARAARRTAAAFSVSARSWGFGQDFIGVNSFTVSALVRITNLGQVQYSEIVRRQGGGLDILFAFQDWGTHLTLGVSTDQGSYVEHDCVINVADFLDKWVWVCAQWDGQYMRVMRCYPGGQIEVLRDDNGNDKLAKTGTMQNVAAGSQVIVGSFGGEYYEGYMSELRLHFSAPSLATLQRYAFHSIPGSQFAPLGLVHYYKFAEPAGSQLVYESVSSAFTMTYFEFSTLPNIPVS